MKKRLLCRLLVIILLVGLMTGCGEQSSDASSISVSQANNEALPKSVSGTYKGQTITLSYQAVTDHLWPYDMPVIHFLNGIAVFYDYGTVDYPYSKDNYALYGYSNTLNCVDTNGRILFNQPYAELSNFNKDGIAYAKTLSGEYVYVNKTSKEVVPSEPYIAPENPLDPAHPAYNTLFEGDFEKRGDSFNPPIQLYDNEGNLISDEEFQNIGNFYNGLAPFLQDGKLGLLGADGQIVIPATYETDVSHLVMLFWEDHMVAEYEGRLAVLKVTRG